MTVLVGVLVGLMLGLTGAGGSVIAVPLLMLVIGLSAQNAIGISLGAVAISALVGGLSKLKSGDIQWLPASVYALVGGIVAPIGNWANRQVDETALMVGFSLLVILVSIRMWGQADKTPQQAAVVRASKGSIDEHGGGICKVGNHEQFRIGLSCVLGVGGGAILTGLLSGLFGVGGGFLIVPTLLFLMGISINQAVATSLIVIAMVSSSGFVSFLLSGSNIDTELLSVIAVGGVLGMTAGICISKYISGAKLQKIFSVLMLFTSAAALIKQLA